VLSRGYGGRCRRWYSCPRCRRGSTDPGGRGGRRLRRAWPGRGAGSGAVGVSVGPVPCVNEATISDGYKQAIVAAASEDEVKFDALNELLPSPGTKGYGTVLRSINTPFINELLTRPELAHRDSKRLLEVLRTAIQAGAVHQVMPTAGQSAGGIQEVLPAAEIVHRMVSQAEMALRHLAG
jgi:nitronate monooxygenase/enoyl-[acyl-carrier protein] reductase II